MNLGDTRYEEIKLIVTRLFRESGSCSIPVGVFFLTKYLGVELVAYSKLSSDKAALALKKSDSGFKFVFEDESGKSTTFICYNDSKNMGHIRFTILHEIGHIVLGHKQDSDLAESEANFFAKYAIAPPVLVRGIKPSHYMDIADVFELSSECALNSMRYYGKWLNIQGYNSYEYELVSMFTFECEGKRILRLKQGA